MQSRYWRTMATGFVVSAALEYAVCFCISLYLNNDSHVFYALLIMLALWGLQIALWVKNTIVSTATYYLLEKRSRIGTIEASLRQHRFPIYDQVSPDAVEYLSMVVQDEQSDVYQIAFASSTIGQIELLKMLKPTYAWRLMSCTEAALDNYRRAP